MGKQCGSEVCACVCVYFCVVWVRAGSGSGLREDECQTAPQAISGKCEKRLLGGAGSSGGGVGPIPGFLFIVS